MGQPGLEPLSAEIFYMILVQGELRKVEVGVKQAPPLVATQVRDLVADMRRRLPMLSTAWERMAMTREIAISV